MADFLSPLSHRFFPKSEPSQTQAEITRNGRLNEITAEIKAISGFPENLLSQTAGVVNFLEAVLNKTIHPYDGGAISWLNLQSQETLKNLGSDILDKNYPNFVIVSSDRMLGKFSFPDEILVVDYRTTENKPVVTSFEGSNDNTKTNALNEFIGKVAEIDNPYISVIKT